MITLKQMRMIESCRQFPNWLDDPRFPRALTFKQFKELQTLHRLELEQNLFDKLKADWISGYEYYMGHAYPWDKVDNTELGILIGKLSRYYKRPSSDELQKIYREFIKFCMTETPDWYQINLSMKLIASASKFPVLIKLYEEQQIPKEKKIYHPGVKDEPLKTLAEILPNIPVKVNQDNK